MNLYEAGKKIERIVEEVGRELDMTTDTPMPDMIAGRIIKLIEEGDINF